MSEIDWDDLRVFLAVTRAGSIRAAARNIGKTHATVSRHIQSLSKALANPVLERRKEGQCLTDLGNRILPMAEQVELSVSEIDRAAFAADSGLAGPVKLSLPESLYSTVLNAPIDAFMQLYPMIDLHVSATDTLYELAWREADVVVRITKSPPEAAFGKKVADSPLALYAAHDYLASRPTRDRWIAFEYEPARRPIIPARVVAHANTLAMAVNMIRMGRGIGLLPCFAGDTEPGLQRMDDVDLLPDMQIWVLTHVDLRHSPRVRALIDHLYDAFEVLRPIVEGRS